MTWLLKKLFIIIRLSYFLQNKNLAATRSALGSPQDAAMCEAFEQLCDLLESSCENYLFNIDQLHQRMTDIMQSEQVYSKKHLQRKLEERYGKYIFFDKAPRWSNVIGFTDICSFLINDMWYNERKKDIANDSERRVKAAAK